MKPENAKILIIENYPGNQEVFTTWLRVNGFVDLKTCTNMAASNFLPSQNFDLILFNWELDDDPAGFDLLDLIPESAKVIHMSLTTSYSVGAKVQQKLKRVDGFVAKFEFADQLIPAIEKVLG